MNTKKPKKNIKKSINIKFKGKNVTEKLEWFFSNVFYCLEDAANNNYTPLISLTKSIANSGSILATYNLGMIYKEGIGVIPNMEQAVTYFNTASIQGYSPAMVELAFAYLSGSGIQRDKKTAIAWLRKAIDNDYEPAQEILTDILTN